MSTYIINNNLHGGSMVSWVGLSYLCDMMLTVVECTWAFDIIMLGATVLGAGLILFTAGPLGIPLALAVSAIGIGAIAAGGLYLKNIGDRFSDATMLMDDYMNGDASAGEKLKYHSLFHGTTVGLFTGVGKYLSKETTAPFFKLWVESKLGYSVSRAFGNTSIGVDGALEILTRISPKYGDTIKSLIDQFGDSIVNEVAESYASMSEYEFQEYIDNTSLSQNAIPEIHTKNQPTDPLYTEPGKLSGEPTNKSSRGLIDQDRAADILVSNGYDVNRLKEVSGGNGYGIAPKSNPDFLINGKEVFDCYSPEAKNGIDYANVDNVNRFTKKVCDSIKVKTKAQSQKIILYMENTPETLYGPTYNRIIGKTKEGQDLQYLDELIVILKDEKIERWFLR